MGAGELFLGEKEERQLAQLRRLRQELERPGRGIPQRIVDAVLGEHAAPPPFGEPAHGP